MPTCIRTSPGVFLILVLISNTGLAGHNNCGFLWAENTHKYLLSPSYGSYPNNLEWCRQIQTEDEGSVVVMEIEVMDLQGTPGICIDYLDIRDGGEVYDKSLGRFCQTNGTRTVNSSSDLVYLRFHSDHSVTARGFKLRFYQRDPDGDIWPSAIAGIVSGSGILLLIAVMCFCSKRHKVIQRDSSVSPIHVPNQPDRSDRSRRQDGGRVGRPRVWAHSVQRTQFIIRGNSRQPDKRFNTRPSDTVDPPVYQELDLSPGKLPSYDEILDEEYRQVISPPPQYKEHVQQEQSSSSPEIPPPEYTSSSPAEY